MADKEQHFNVRAGSSYARSIGITHRTTPLACSWTGDMRLRFSDFQVNEIPENGSVLHLRNIGLGNETNPDQIQKTPESKPSNTTQNDKAQTEQTIEIPEEDIKILQDLSTEQFAQDLIKLFNKGNGPSKNDPDTATSPVLEDKSKRGELHQEVRRIFKSRLETTTGHDGVIVANYNSPRKNGKKSRGRRGQPGDDEPMGQYVHFTLYKDNRDTMDAVNQISRLLRIKPQVIGYAGTKDRRASTTQRCSVRYQRKTALAGLNGKLWGISTGDYEYKDGPVYLGQLLGNEFVITLKNCKMVTETASQTPAERLSSMKENVESALKHMSSHGWINYFGHQRFGTHEVGTHEVGRLILGDNFEGAVNALLQYNPEIAEKAEDGTIPDEPSKRDDYLRHQACMLFHTGKDLNKAAKIMPRRFAAEACIVRHLTRNGNSSSRDFAGAITHITRGLRSMYLHAYQSHVWNHIASKRYAEHGSTVVKGDLIICDGETQPAVVEKDQDGDEIINPVDDEEDAPLRARPLTEEEAASGKYTIYDIVLPSPGYDVVYPDNEIGKFYEEFMGREENGSLDPHKMRRLRREFSLPGRYRKLMHKFLAEPSVEFKLYEDDTEQMHPTDLDLIKGAQKNGNESKRKRDDKSSEGGVAKKSKTNDGEVEPEETIKNEATIGQEATSNGAAEENETKPDVEPTKIAVVVKFQLASSAYATVTLRELMGDRSEEDTVPPVEKPDSS